METIRIPLIILSLVVVGVCTLSARADIVDYEYFYDPQSQSFAPVYDPLSWGAPQWITATNMEVPNVARPDPWHKDVGVTVGYIGGTAPATPPNWIWVMTETGGMVLTEEWALEYDLSGNEVWKGTFRLSTQPGSETVGFVEAGFRNGQPLASGFTVDGINVSSLCVPEPAALALLAMGVAAIVRRRKRQAAV